MTPTCLGSVYIPPREYCYPYIYDYSELLRRIEMLEKENRELREKADKFDKMISMMERFEKLLKAVESKPI